MNECNSALPNRHWSEPRRPRLESHKKNKKKTNVDICGTCVDDSQDAKVLASHRLIPYDGIWGSQIAEQILEALRIIP